MRNATRAGLLPVLGMLCLVGCGGGKGAPAGYTVADILSSPPAGVSSGNPWSMAKASVRSDGTTLSVALFADGSTPDCSMFPPNGSTQDYLMWNEPAQTGSRTLQLNLSDFTDPTNQTVTFVTPPSSNDISVDGILNVSSVSSSSVTIGVLAKAGNGYDVNGTFTASICP